MQFLRYIFVMFVVGAFSSSSIFADEEVQLATPLEISYQIPPVTQTKESASISDEVQKSTSVIEKEAAPKLEESTKQPSLTEVKTSSSVAEEAQKPTPLNKVETPSNLSKEVESPKSEESPKAPSLTEVRTASTPPTKQGNGRVYMHFPSTKGLLSSNSVFFQTNIGVGFLYFNGIKGNLMGRPVPFFVPASNWRDAPFKGRLSYNRTPLYEYLLGRRLNAWFKVALSYQYQGGITVQSEALHTFTPGTIATPAASNYAQFTSNLSLNAFLLKFYFELPNAAVFKNLAITPYLAVGVGPGWQSWTQIETNYMRGTTFYVGAPVPLRQKISANAVWMLDSGFRLQSHSKDPSFSVLFGCKYNQWGQARSMGKMSEQQGNQKLALTDPLRIKMVHQFAPYFGFQWNFVNSYASKSSYCLKGKSPNVRLPYIASTTSFQASKALWTQFNVGLGLLYFSGVKGNLMGRPVLDFFPSNLVRDVPIKGRLSYNKTPLFEYLLGYRVNSWAKVALSYQYQSGVVVQTKSLFGFADTFRNTSARFSSNLSLNAILFKLYFELPYAMIMKNLSVSPHLAAGVGPGWQSWTNIKMNYISATDSLQTGFNSNGGPLFLSQKISANAVWMIDLGFRAQSVYPNGQFSALVGCKYNQWGQARSMGEMSEQDSHKLSLTKPVKIKTVYQFAPYLGVQWNFLNTYTPKSSYCLKGKNSNVWLPYWAGVKNFQCPKGFLAQFNVGVGFLYFSGVSGNLMGRPASNFTSTSQWRDAPYKGKLSYNPTPLFEYLVGYKFNNWLKLALSYQHQGGVAIQTKAHQGFPAGGQSTTDTVRLSSNLTLDSLLAKVYFELPFAMIWKSLSTSPYLAIGVGPGWQSWTSTRVNYSEINTFPGFRSYVAHDLPLRNKLSANAVWMVDAGFRIQSAYPKSAFSVLLGCKYNQWGQARSIGKMSQQGAHKLALSKPLTVKTVYQFAPYFGVQWNF